MTKYTEIVVSASWVSQRACILENFEEEKRSKLWERNNAKFQFKSLGQLWKFTAMV